MLVARVKQDALGACGPQRSPGAAKTTAPSGARQRNRSDMAPSSLSSHEKSPNRNAPRAFPREIKENTARKGRERLKKRSVALPFRGRSLRGSCPARAPFPQNYALICPPAPFGTSSRPRLPDSLPAFSFFPRFLLSPLSPHRLISLDRVRRHHRCRRRCRHIPPARKPNVSLRSFSAVRCASFPSPG